jgi:hypothetical protein
MKKIILFVFGLLVFNTYSQTEVISEQGASVSESPLTSKTIDLFVSPNPVADFVTIQAEGIVGGRIRVVDILGNIVHSSDFNNVKRLNLSDYKNGIYFLTVQSESNKGLTKKLVVRH